MGARGYEEEPDLSEEPTATIDQHPPHRRHRAIVWTLVVLASVLLVFSIAANWVQRAVLDTGQVTQTTDEILANQDVQEQLSVFAVDQLYANVDVQGAIADRLPPPAAPLAGPLAAAARELATDVADKALASPQVQSLVSGAISTAHSRFVALIEDEGTYVSTTGGEVTLEYGKVIADLAARLGLDPGTITEIQDFVQSFSQQLQESLTTAQTKIKSVRSDLAGLQSGQLDSTTATNLRELNQLAAELTRKIGKLQAQIDGIKGKVPSQLKGALKELDSALSELEQRLTKLERSTAAVLANPDSAKVADLDSELAALETQITSLLNRQVVQTPGQLVIMDSSELSGVQTIFGLLRSLGIVLPILVVLLYLAALFLAKGWRREALIAAGGGIVAATLFVLVIRRLAGNEVTSLASSETVEPAVQAVWDIISVSLRDRARFVLVVGIVFVAGGVFAGPGRYAISARRFIAPFLRQHPVAVYSIVGALFLLWLAFTPGIDTIGQVISILVLAALAALGVELLRRQTAREFPAPTTPAPQPPPSTS